MQKFITACEKLGKPNVKISKKALNRLTDPQTNTQHTSYGTFMLSKGPITDKK